MEDQDVDGHQETGASVLFVVSLGIGFFYSVCISTVFCVLMGALVVSMLLPGIYLYMVDGCRPEEYSEE